MDIAFNNLLNICHNYYEYLLSLDNVVGVCIGNKIINGINTYKTCVNVLVTKKINAKYLSTNNIIPKTYMGITTDVIEIGVLKPYMIEPVIGKFRPLVSGCEISIKESDGTFTSGTLGGIVYKNIDDKVEYYILTNNHIFSVFNQLPIGTPIIQTNPFKNTSSNDVIAHLTSFVPLMSSDETFTYLNQVDAAIAKLIDSQLISKSAFRIGRTYGVNSAKLNQIVQKVGASSGVTEGRVIGLGATISLRDSDNKLLFFKDQIILDIEGLPGDSGSLVFNDDIEAIGLLIGGSEDGVAYANDINVVLDKFNVKLYTD